jgi:NADPH-ferrihemoprotein reductase
MRLSNSKLIICFLYFQEELSKLSEINNSLVIFCMATYGEGDPTDNASAFYEWLKTEEPDLTGVNYAV